MNKHESKPVTLPDDTDFNLGANYDAVSIGVDNPDPDMKYFLAADDGNKYRPDGAHRVQQMGYRKSDKAHNSPDCVLMEIPMNVWDARQKSKQEENMRKQGAAIKPGPGLNAQPGHGSFVKPGDLKNG